MGVPIVADPEITVPGHEADGGSPAPTVLEGLDGLQARLGDDLGVSSWRTVTQDDISTFARLTGDEQWIHVDAERAADGPYGTTIQHGFLTLGMATGFLWEVCVVEGFGVVLNYGLNRVRFPAPLKLGGRFRMHVTLSAVTELESPSGAGAEADQQREARPSANSSRQAP